MKKITGITADTYQRLLLDSGVVYLNYGEHGEKVIGATRGGNTASIETEYREMPADGSCGPVKGSQRIIRSTAKLTVNLLEMTTDAILATLPASESTVVGLSDKITRSEQISNSDYFNNVTLVLQKSDQPDVYFAVKFKNVLNLGNFEIAGSEDDESVLTIEFTAHFDPDNQEEEPWEIFNPTENLDPIYTLTYLAGTGGTIVGDAVQQVEQGDDGTVVVATPNISKVFVKWSDDNANATRQDLNVQNNITVVAIFEDA